MRSKSRNQWEQSEMFTSLDTSADHCSNPRFATAQQAGGKDRGRGGSDARNIRAVHHAGGSSGVGIEQVNQGQVVWQIDLQIAVEHVDNLDRQLHSRTPSWHR
jgi:hypothetical protein